MNQENIKEYEEYEDYEYEYPKLAPFKIEIERNVELLGSKTFTTDPLFTIKVNGKKFENVKRFCIDLDSDKLRETIKINNSGSTQTSYNPWTYTVEFYDDPLCDDFEGEHTGIAIDHHTKLVMPESISSRNQ